MQVDAEGRCRIQIDHDGRQNGRDRVILSSRRHRVYLEQINSVSALFCSMPSLSNCLVVVAAAVALPSSSSQAAVSSFTQYSHAKSEDDPGSRISSAAETINKRLRRRHQKAGRIYKRNGADESSSSSSSSSLETAPSTAQRLPQPQHLTNSLIEDLVLSPRIIGGTASTPNRYPYLVSLTYFGSHICGGSLVAKDMVLTAAHCAGFATTVELGRYDKTIPYDETIHETIDVAYEIAHPLWDPDTIDNDFMLMKLVHPSNIIEKQDRNDVRISLIQLNTDPNAPSIAGEKLTIMGWGDTNADPDLLEPSMQVLETQLEYVPNDVCLLKEGVVDGEEIHYESTITGNMMCAMDEDGAGDDAPVDEDSCLGDSGSPVIISLSDGEDVQVGIVSMGIGCASPIFPGIYSRVSSQYEWIRGTVCQYSHTAPTSFNCDETINYNFTGVGLLSDDDESVGLQPYVTLELSLDEKPEEFSWVVSPLLPGRPMNQLVAIVPPGFYSGFSNYTFHHKLLVSQDNFYRISLRDSFGDGMKGYVAVYRGKALMTNLIMHERLLYDENRANMRLDHAFYTGRDPQNFFSLKIKFDNYPDDLYWKLESVTDSVILAQRHVGWYSKRFKLMTIVEKIPVFGDSSNINPQYRFTIGDSHPCVDDPTKICGDGICCEYGNGKFELFAGAVEDGKILTSGGDYDLVHSVLITIPRSEVSL